MMRARFAVSVVTGSLVAAYLLAFIHPFGDMLTRTQSVSTVEWGRGSIPSSIRGVLTEKCGDCHSHDTRKPLYAHLAPASWLIERDIARGRSAMDLSEWDSESVEDRQILMAKIAHVAAKREMPPLQYLVVHRGARLTSDDIHALSEWAQSSGPTIVRSQSSGLAIGDAGRGKAVFEKRCTGCHALNRDREGPQLGGVYGRTAGSVTGFDYSKALKASKIVWDETTLERWLTNPESMVPGADMDFYLSKPDERADVIAFLKEETQRPDQPK